MTEIHVYTVSVASQPCANAGKQTGFLGIIDHRMNSNRSIKSFILTSFFFFTNHLICLVRTVVVTTETLHLQCRYTEALSLNTDDGKQAPQRLSW